MSSEIHASRGHSENHEKEATSSHYRRVSGDVLSDKTGDGVKRGGGSETRVEPSVSQSVSAHRAARSSLAGSPTDTMALRHRPPLVPSSTTTTTCEVCTEFFFWARRVQAKVCKQSVVISDKCVVLG